MRVLTKIWKSRRGILSKNRHCISLLKKSNCRLTDSVTSTEENCSVPFHTTQFCDILGSVVAIGAHRFLHFFVTV